MLQQKPTAKEVAADGIRKGFMAFNPTPSVPRFGRPSKYIILRMPQHTEDQRRAYQREYMKQWRAIRSGGRPARFITLRMPQRTHEERQAYQREYMKRWRALGRDTWLKKKLAK